MVEISLVETSQVPTRGHPIKKSVDFWAAQISQVRGKLDANSRSILTFLAKKKKVKSVFKPLSSGEPSEVESSKDKIWGDVFSLAVQSVKVVF